LRRLLSFPSWAARRLRPRLLAILQTAAAAVAAYYVALLLPLDDNKPVFASIAAVISIGASYHQRGRRAAELVAGVVVGLTVADLIIHAIGTGPLQIGLMIVIAMSAAVILGGGELLVSEAAVSALLLASLERTSSGYSPDRFIEAVVGGIVAMAVASVFFPPDPALIVGRAAQTVFADLGETLERVASALEAADPERAEHALRIARGIDADTAALEEAVATAREMVRFAPPRRGARSVHDDPARSTQARDHARLAAARARETFEQEPDLTLTEIIGQVRSTAVDVIRSADAIAGAVQPADEVPTEEMLAAPPD
jgi:uncharacterized membrane protein YgaE (UPF0421/DUF939 family)